MKLEAMESLMTLAPYIHVSQLVPLGFRLIPNCCGCPTVHQQRAASTRLRPYDEDSKHGKGKTKARNPQGSTNQGSQGLEGIIGSGSSRTIRDHP